MDTSFDDHAIHILLQLNSNRDSPLPVAQPEDSILDLSDSDFVLDLSESLSDPSDETKVLSSRPVSSEQSLESNTKNKETENTASDKESGENPPINGVSYNPSLDAIHRMSTTTPTDIDGTWYYWVLHYYMIEKYLKRDIVLRLQEMYPWYRNQERTEKSKAIELTRLLKDMDNGTNYRLAKQITRVNDEAIICALEELETAQRRSHLPIKQGDWHKILTTPVNRDTFKRRTGKIVRQKYLDPKTKQHGTELLQKVKSIHGPWKIPEWNWYYD